MEARGGRSTGLEAVGSRLKIHRGETDSCVSSALLARPHGDFVNAVAVRNPAIRNELAGSTARCVRIVVEGEIEQRFSPGAKDMTVLCTRTDNGRVASI